MWLFVLIGACFLIFAIGRWWYGERQVTRRALLAARRARIAEVGAGARVKLVGKLAYAGEPLCAPFSRRKCALYWVAVEDRHASRSEQWAEILQDRQMVSFWVEDESGRALVEADVMPHVAMVVDAHFDSGLLDDPEPHIRAWATDRGIETQGMLFNKTLRYRESVLEAGDTVAVLGEAHWERDPDPEAQHGYRERAKRLVVRAPADGRLMLSDDPSTLR